MARGVVLTPCVGGVGGEGLEERRRCSRLKVLKRWMMRKVF